MQDLIEDLRSFLEKLDKQKDQFLFRFVRKRWPRRITPNHLTILRIFIGLGLLFLLFNFKNDNGLFILPLFLIGALTDLLDGVIARGLNMETKFGIVMDPIADRILIIPIAIYTLMPDYNWLLLFLIFLEIENAFISVLGQGKKIIWGSNTFGKWKMVMQSVVFIAILVFWPRTINLFFIYLLYISIVLMIISIFLKIIKLKEYYDKTAA
ncbi:MAG: CDP-alcohol phosphatidyltransferase family protein [bacterium]|nr:CDP-alcohol phosphatidyltransferase family protein [bacterium]